MKYYFIINPNSGKIDTNQFEQRILKECSKEKIKYKIFYTHNAGDAKKFAKKIPDEECDLDIVPNKGRNVEVKYVMSNSLGFGGHNASIIFKKYGEE